MLSRYCVLMLCLSLLLSSLSLVLAEHPLGLNENQPYGILTDAYVTPHIPWAKPYYRGKIRALVLAPEWSQRETVELAERLSLDFTSWMTASFTQVVLPAQPDPAFSFFQAPPEVVYRALREDLKKDYDVILIGKLDWRMLPARQRFALLKKVAEGTGLVYVDPPKQNPELDIVFAGKAAPEGHSFIEDNLPLAVLPRFKGKAIDGLVRTNLFGKGRVVVLDYRESIPQKDSDSLSCLTPQWDMSDSAKSGFVPLDKIPEAEFVAYEYYQAFVARAALWAGKKEPEVRLRSINVPASPSWPVTGQRITVELEHLSSSAMLKAVVRDARDPGNVHPMGERKAGAEVDIALPNLPAGQYIVDVWVMAPDGKDVLTWGSQDLTVITDFTFGAIALDRNRWEAGEPISGTVTLPRLLEKNERLILNLWDNYGRRIQSQALTATTTHTSRTTVVPFRFVAFRPLTYLHRVEAQLFRGGREVCAASLTFPIRAKPRWDDFKEVVWSGGENNFITHLMLKKLAEVDETDAIDIGWRGPTNARDIALANLAQLPYTARYGCLGAGKDHIVAAEAGNAYGCMSNPLTLEAVDKWGAQQSEIFGPYGPFAWTHGDETNYGLADPDLCWSPTCLAAFRKYLQGAYADLEALNKEWGTSCKTWEEVMPLSFKEAKESKSYARWLEHRLSSDRVFAAFYRRTAEALSKNDPEARAGFDGGVGLEYPNSGADWWVLSKNVGILQAYMVDSAQMEVFRSFANRDQVTGMWYGTYGLTWQVGPNTAPYCHFFPWYTLFHGLNTTWFWTMGSPGLLCGYAPDLSSMPFFAARTEALRQIKSGIGKLLLSGTRQNDRIAIHFSEASRIAESLYATRDGDWSTGYAQALVSFNKALEDCGLQYDYLSYDQVANGDLNRKGFKVFVMPHSRSVSDAEAREIRAFVQKGGVVIADILPGILNGHGTPQKQSVLADLFPVDKPGTVTPAGKGKAILSGDLLSGYGQAHMSQHGWKELKNRGRLIGDLLKDQAEVTPQITIASVRSEKIPPTEVTRISVGDIEFIGLLREYFLYDERSYAARVVFPRKAHLYDVLAGKYLGFTDRIDTDLSYRARLFALSPYKVGGLNLSTPAAATSGVPTALQITVKTNGNANPTKHAFRVEVISPDGNNLAHYAQNLIAENCLANAKIPWALNDPPGKYTIMVRDVMSGIATRRAVMLRVASATTVPAR